MITYKVFVIFVPSVLVNVLYPVFTVIKTNNLKNNPIICYILIVW